MRKAKRGPWFQDVIRRARFERSVHDGYDVSARCNGRGYGAKITYRTAVEVPDFDDRVITIKMSNLLDPFLDAVVADGPTASPHRYGERRLCMWHPSDPADRKWQPEDGLLHLIIHARQHLFREAWWRVTGEWLGQEAPHGPLPKEAP